jgi:hypothetical protein
VKGLSSSPETNGRKRICRLPVSILLIALCFILLTSATYPAFASQAVLPTPLKSNSQAPTTLLQENFDDGVAQGFGNEAGGWKVIDGKYTATTGQFRFSTAGDLSWQDYVIEADYTNAQDGGLLVRVQDFNNCISLVIRPNYNDVGFNIRKNGIWGPGLGTVPLGHKAGSNIHVKIEVSGGDIQAYINGELKTTLKTADFPKGKIGVYLFSPGNQYWDNIVVYSDGTSSNPTPVARGLLYQATLKSGNYGGGLAVSPSTGLVNSSEGVKFVSTEPDKQSNALINWVVPADRRVQFRSQGTISFLFKADRQNHVDGAILGDNGGFSSFNNGQSTFSVVTYRLPNGSGIEDDQFHIKWSTWHNADWKYHPPGGQPNLVMEYDRWYNLGFTWGGPSSNFEIWVSGTLQAQDSQAGAALPWGDASMGTGSGTNIGLGDNHERGVDQNNSIAGVTFADIRIWDEYRTNGDTRAVQGGTSPSQTQTPAPPATASGLVAFYPFDSDYQDHSGAGNHGALKGSIPFIPAAVGNGAKFDGKSWLEVNDSVSLDLHNAYTFSAWIYKENAGAGGWSVILEKADSSAMDNRSPYGFAHTQDGYSPTVHFAYNNKFTTISSDTRTNFKEWNLTTVAWDGVNVRFYINGVLKATKAWNNTLPDSTSKLSIGRGPAGSTEYFIGIIDELRIYNRALSQEEITSLYGAGTPGSSAPVSPPPSISTQIPQPPTSAPKPSQLVTPSQTPGSTLPSGLTFESRSKASGSTVQIPLTLRDAKEKIGNIDLTLTYDLAVLKAGEAQKGGLTTGSIFDFNVTSPGTIKISLADKTGFEGDGSVAYVTFSVIGAAGATSPLKIASASANRASDMASVTLATHDGVFKVLGNDQLKGDFDGDGKLTALDALAALQMAVGKRSEDLVMDVTEDGKVTSADARKILQIAVITPASPASSTIPSTSKLVESPFTQLINNVGSATDDARRKAALEKVVTSGFSLGLLDEKGSQLNPNVSPNAVSLTADDKTVLANLAGEQQGRTIGSVIDYLASFGVALASTGNIITFKDLLPDLEKYVKWSFQNPKNQKAVLGLLLASGLEMKVPPSPPVFTEYTPISSMAAMMMLADILLGVPGPQEVSSWEFWGSKVYAAEAQEIAKNIQGNMTLIERTLKLFGRTVPEAAKQIINAYAVGNKFGVRLVLSSMNKVPNVPAISKINMPASRQLLETQWALRAVVRTNLTGKILTDIPVFFDLKLISPESGLIPDTLYSDADAVLDTPFVDQSKIELNRHRLKMLAQEPQAPADFVIRRTTASNQETRVAMLLASASIEIPDLKLIKEEYQKEIEALEALLSLPGDKAEAMLKAFTIAPWFSFVVLYPEKVITVEPYKLTGGKAGQGYTFKAKQELPDTLLTTLRSKFTYNICWFKDKVAPQMMSGVVGQSLEIRHRTEDKVGEEFKVSWEKDGVYELTVALYEHSDNDMAAIWGKAGEVKIEVNISGTSQSDLFPAASLSGPVVLYPSSGVNTGSGQAGIISMRLNTSGGVTGNWGGEYKDQQGRIRYRFNGTFSGAVASPDYLSFTNVAGNYNIEEFNSEGAMTKTLEGKMELRGAIEWVYNAAGERTLGTAQATLRDEKGLMGDWKSK